MADYKRMISYIYNYEKGTKKNNVGYARIEIRNAQCKLTVHVKAPSIKGSLKVCFFLRGEEGVQCIELGEMGVQNGIGEFQTTTPANDLMKTDYTFDEMKGLLLYESKDKFFGSEWDDRPIQLQKIRFVEKGEKKATETPPMLMPEEVHEKDREEHIEEASDAAMDDVKGDSNKALGEVAVSETKTREESRVESAGELDKPEDSDKKGPGTKTFDAEDLSKQLQAAEFATKMLNFQKPVTKSVKQTKRSTVSGRQIKKDEKNVDFAEYLMEEYPKMYPFEDDEIAGCVRIEPQDIGMFPMEMWTLANNSFLLQGYFSYRHLIFVQTKIMDKKTYLLGVPGIYHNREEFMAKMFGFQMFKTVKRKENKRGEFGYWFIHIKVPKK